MSPASVAHLEAFSAELRRQSAAIARAVRAGQMSAASEIAAGRPPETLPAIGTTSAAYRRRLSARALAARHGITEATAETIWNMYSAGLLADDCQADLDALSREEMATSAPSEAHWPARGPRLVISCTRPSRGLSARWASNAPPAPQRAHMPSVNAGGATT
jgi:hypothetical protein